MSQLQVTGEAKVRDIQGPVVANSGVITALDGDASQYVRGDGTLADFPTSSGGGSSVSYYLNSSVSQGTIGGVAYRELSKEPIIGAGTDIAISTTGYVASYLTDANDPDVLSIPGGNFNCEFYFSVNSNNHNPFFYAELYKYDGTTFTLLGSSVGVPEYINQGTIIAPYYFAIPVPTSALALTDRLAIRIYVNVDGRTVTLHTENGHLCQVVTTLSKGMVSLNNLTDQSQFITTGTSGTNFAIVSSGDTHTFNLPIASATNTGKLSSTDWSTFNGKVPYTGATANVDLGIYALAGHSFNARGQGASGGVIALKQNGQVFAATGSAYIGSESAGKLNIYFGDTGLEAAILDNSLLTADRTYNLPNLSGTLALLEGSQTFSGSKTFSVTTIQDAGIVLKDGVYPSPQTGYVGFASNGVGITIVRRSGVTSYNNNFQFPLASNDYNFPNATGTIALTSNLSAYLPLTGGTLTGPLNGTSGVFSSTMQASAYRLTGMTAGSGALYWTSDRVTLANYNATGVVHIEANGGAGVATFGGGTFNSDFVGTGRFTGALTGTSASFSSNVAIGGATSPPTAGLKVLGNIISQTGIYVDNVEGGVYADYYGRNSGGSTALTFIYGSSGGVVWNNGGTKMTLTSAGALQLVGGLSATTGTFSSSVTAAELGSTSGIYVARNGSNTQGSGPYFLLSNAASSQLWYQQLNASNGLDYWYNGSLKMAITSAGSVLVNATSSTYGAASGYNLGVKGTSGQAFISIARTGQNLDSQGIILGLDTAAAQLTMIDNLPLTFGTNNTTRMTISNIGGVYIAAPTTGGVQSTLNLLGANDAWNIEAVNNGVTGSSYGIIVTAGTNSTDSSLLVRGKNTTTYFRVRGDGYIIMNSLVYNNTTAGSTRTVFMGSDFYLGGISSIRASKKNIENISNINWLYELNPVTFNYRKKDINGNYTNEAYNELNYGLIAEDTSLVADFLINYDDKEDGTKEMVGIEYSRLITPMLKAIQEQQAQIESNIEIINELKERIVTLESK
jgi:hypothetical protein